MISINKNPRYVHTRGFLNKLLLIKPRPTLTNPTKHPIVGYCYLKNGKIITGGNHERFLVHYYAIDYYTK